MTERRMGPNVENDQNFWHYKIFFEFLIMYNIKKSIIMIKI